MRFWGDRNIVLGAKNRTEGFDPNVGSKAYDGSSGNGGYTRIADNAIAGANNSIRDLSFRNSVYGSNNTVTAGADNMIIGSGNDIQAAYVGSFTYDDKSVSGVVNDVQTIGNLWRIDTSGSGDSIKAKSSQLQFGDSNSIIGSRNTIQYNTDHNFLAGSDNIAYADSRYNFMAGSKNAAGVDLSNKTDVENVVKNLLGLSSIAYGTGSLSDAQKIEIALSQIRSNTLSLGGTAGNLLAGSYNISGKGSSGNIVQGNNVTISNNVTNSYVLGSRVDVTQSNSVYIGDNSVATLNPTAVTDVDPTTKKTKQTNLQFEADTKFEDLSLRELNTLITAGERGQQAITINGKQYNFAGLGKTGGGVISVGGIRVEGNATDGYKNVSYGRIIQNVAPGLVGANSTDAINGSQLFAIYNAIDATVKQVVSGERGTVVYTTPNGTRLLREGNTLYSQELATGYQRAIDGLWYKKEDFNTDGTLLNPSNIFGKTLLDLNTNGAYFQANDGKWYTRDQLLTEKQQNKYVPKEGATGGLTDDQFATIKAGFTNRTFDSKQVILSLVNAEKQSDPSTENDATKARTILANLKEALPILGETDLTAKAKELYLKDNTANTEASWTALGTDGQKTWLAKAASEQAKAAVTALLAKSDVTDAHELSKAATLQDLKTLSIAGLDFAGDSGTNVHRNLSETLAIKGGLTDASKLSDNNIGVVANGTDALVVKLAKDIVGLSSTNYGTVTSGSAPNTTTIPFSGFTKDLYMKSARDPRVEENKFLGNALTSYVSSVDQTGLHLGGINGQNKVEEKATVALINPQNSLSENSVGSDGKSVIFTTAGNGGAYLTPADETDPAKADNLKAAYDGKIFGNYPLGLLVGTLAAGSNTTMTGSTGNGFGLFMGFNNGVLPEGQAQPTIFNGVTTTSSATAGVQNAGGSSAVVVGAFNSISGNGGLAVGTLNRVYGNEGIVIGNTTLANSYSSVGRFGVTMGFNVKAGEWSKQSVVIGSNLQSVGQGNIVLGGGENKFYGTGSGWKDTINENGVYTTLANTFDASGDNLSNSGMRFWGDHNIVVGAKNRTEGFNTSFTAAGGYTGSTGNGGYQRITENSVVGTNNSLYDLSSKNSVYGSNNVIASGTNNMVIGSDNRIQAQYNNGTTRTTITGNITGRTEAEIAAIAALGSVNDTLDTNSTSSKDNGKLLFGNNNSIIGSRNTVGFNSVHNFLAGDDNVVTPNASYNFLAGSRNVSGVNLSDTTTNTILRSTFAKIPGLTDLFTDDLEHNLGLIQNFQLSNLLGSQTGMNLLAGSLNVAGQGAQNNIVQGGNVILRDGVKNTYVFGSHIDANQSRSVYMGDYSVATLTPLTTTKGEYTGDVNNLPKNGTAATEGQSATIGLNDLITAGNKGQTSIQINGKTYNFAGQGYTQTSEAGAATRTIANDVGVITVGRVVNEGTAEQPNYKSYGRIIQNVAPGLIGANSTDAVNGSQLYAIWDAMESSVARVVSGLDGNVVYTTDKGHRLYSWNNVLYDSSLVVDGKFKLAANGQWYPESAFNGQELKAEYAKSTGFTLAEIETAKEQNKTLSVEGRDTSGNKVTVSSTAWSNTDAMTVNKTDAVLSLVDGEGKTVNSIELFNVSNALSLPASGSDTQSAPQIAVSKLIAGKDLNNDGLGNYDLSQATTLKDLQTVALAGLDFTGDTQKANANTNDKTVHRSLSQALSITGGITAVGDLSTENNIGVVSSNADGALVLRLAKALKGLTSAEYVTTNGGKTTINASGVTIQGSTPEGGSAPAPISITTSGINAGNTNITNVKSGLAANSTTIDNNNSSYGATLGDVQKLVNAAAWDIGQTTTTTTTDAGGSSTTTSTYTSTGQVNNAERVSFDAGTGTKVTLTKTPAVTGDNPKPETYSVVFAVKTQELERNSISGQVTIKEGGDTGGYATAENIKNILDSINTSLTSATFGLADSNNGTAIKKLSNTIQVTGYDSNITTEVAKSSAQATANDVLKIKLSPTVTLGDTATSGTSGSLVVKNKGAADQASAIKLSNGQITFKSNAMSSGTYTDYVLSLVSGTKIPGGGQQAPIQLVCLLTAIS